MKVGKATEAREQCTVFAALCMKSFFIAILIRLLIYFQSLMFVDLLMSSY